MKWRIMDIAALVPWLQGKSVFKREPCPEHHYNAECVSFTDGTAMMVKSEYEGGYSEWTPGGPLDPSIWVYE